MIENWKWYDEVQMTRCLVQLPVLVDERAPAHLKELLMQLYCWQWGVEYKGVSELQVKQG